MINYDEWASKWMGIEHKYPQWQSAIRQKFSPTTSDSDYMILVKYARNHEKWEDFIEFLLHEYWLESSIAEIIHLLFSRELGTKAIYEYFSKEEGK